MSDSGDGKVIYLDLHRRNWSVGLIYCADCDRSGYQLWVTGAQLVECPNCHALISLELDE